MSNDGFRFSHDKWLGKVSFEDFLTTAKKLAEIVFNSRSTANTEVSTAEDRATYNYTTVTFFSDEVTEGMKNKKSYTLDELTQEIWNRSFDVRMSLFDDKDSKPFMICISCDKYADARRIRFYGQCLDEKTYQDVTEEFYHSSFWYKLGDGYSKPSLFNQAIGSKLSGMHLD